MDDKLTEVKTKTILCDTGPDSKQILSIAHFLQCYLDVFKQVDKSYRHHLKNAAEKVIAKIASSFTGPEYVGDSYEGQSDDQREIDGFSVFMFGKLADEDKLYSDWRLQFISESDRMVRDLLPGGGSNWEKREFETQEECKKQMWCVSGPMKIVRVMKGE
jgi:hypothetical protein